MNGPKTWRNKYKDIKTWALRNPVIVMFIISLLLLSYTLIKVAQYRSFNSDDVSWQTILLHWQPFSGSVVTLGLADIFIDKLPIFMLFGWILPPGLPTLIGEAVIFSAISFSLFYLAAVYFLKKSGIKPTYGNLLPIVWVATLGYSFAQLSLSPMWRTLETGFTFFTFMLAAMTYFGDIKPMRTWKSKLSTLLFLAIGGIVAYSDPYWLYFTVGPIILFAIVLLYFKKLRIKQFVWLLGGSAGIMLFTKVSAYVTYQAGIRGSGDYPARFVDFESLPHNILVGIHSLLVLFDANFFGKEVHLSGSLIVSLLNGTLLFLIICSTYFGIKLLLTGKVESVSASSIAQTFLSLFAVLVFAAYVTSTLAEIASYRYLYIIAFSASIALSLWLSSTPQKSPKQIVTILLFLVIAGNLAATTRGVPGYMQVGNLGNNVGNSANQEVINAVRKAGLKKGYANYWNSHINTYLADGDIDFLSSICQDGRSHLFPWLAFNDRYAQPATRSFFLVDPNIPYVPTCTESEIITQLGLPEQIIELSNDRRLLIWNYDIAQRM